MDDLQPQDFGIGRLFWRIREGVVVGDAVTGQIVLWSPAAESMFGYTAAEAEGQPIEILIPEHLRARHRAGLARFAASGQSELMDADVGLELPAIRKDGQELTIELLLSPVDDPPREGRFVLAVIRDITARRLAEERRIELAREQSARAAAEAEQQQFALLAEASRLLATSLDWETTLSNVARLLVPGLADWCIVDIANEDGSLRSVEIAAADPAFEPLLRESVTRSRRSPGWEQHPTSIALRTGEPQLIAEIRYSALAIIADDEEHLDILRRLRPRSVIAVPLMSRGRTLGVLTVLGSAGRRPYTAEDVPLIRELGLRAATAVEHAALFQQARDAISIREEFISVAAHELKTPLTSLRGFTQLLRRRLEGADDLDVAAVRASVEQIDRQAGKLSRLVEQLLDIARLRAGKLRLEPYPTDLVRLLRDLTSSMQLLTSRHEIVVRGPVSARATVDPIRLEQVLINLIDNAIKYSPEGGPIEIEVDEAPAECIRIAIADRGTGIPAEHRHRVFDRFYQVDAASQVAGMGLGLYVCREIVSLHGGQIEAEERPGGGTRVVITVPKSLHPPAPSPLRGRGGA